MCLTFLLNKFCKQNNISLVAITVDHKLRKGSTIEANNIYRYLEKYGINHTVLTWNHNEIKSNIQKEARNVRYKMLCDFCKPYWCAFFCTSPIRRIWQNNLVLTADPDPHNPIFYCMLVVHGRRELFVTWQELSSFSGFGIFFTYKTFANNLCIFLGWDSLISTIFLICSFW